MAQQTRHGLFGGPRPVYATWQPKTEDAVEVGAEVLTLDPLEESLTLKSITTTITLDAQTVTVTLP